jgi:hypothetical protein
VDNQSDFVELHILEPHLFIAVRNMFCYTQLKILLQFLLIPANNFIIRIAFTGPVPSNEGYPAAKKRVAKLTDSMNGDITLAVLETQRQVCRHMESSLPVFYEQLYHAPM